MTIYSLNVLLSLFGTSLFFHVQNFPQFAVIHTVKGFGIVKAEVDVFLELSCFFHDPVDVGNAMKLKDAYSLEEKYEQPR